MTIPTEPQPPSTVGTSPRNADEVNGLVGLHLRDFLRVATIINQDQDWLNPTDLKVAPYFFTDEQEALIKSALSGLDEALDAIDRTFISRLVGMG
jgi:predicted transcriptional regulator